MILSPVCLSFAKSRLDFENKKLGRFTISL
jgi:hypothetical protein